MTNLQLQASGMYIAQILGGWGISEQFFCSIAKEYFKICIADETCCSFLMLGTLHQSQSSLSKEHHYGEYIVTNNLTPDTQSPDTNRVTF